MSLFLLDDGTLFIHLVKCGGTSIRTDHMVDPVPRFYAPDPEWTYTQAWTIVRNPYDRFESAYRDFRYLRGLTEDEPETWLRAEYMRDIDNPGSAGHHLLPMLHPMQGIQYADDDCIYRFETYPFQRHLRSNDDTPEMEWTQSLRSLVRKIYEDDFVLWRRIAKREGY